MPTKEAIIEGVKEVSRLVMFAALGVVVTYLINTIATLPQTETTLVVGTILRFLDKAIHESKTGTFKDVNGISPV